MPGPRQTGSRGSQFAATPDYLLALAPPAQAAGPRLGRRNRMPMPRSISSRVGSMRAALISLRRFAETTWESRRRLCPPGPFHNSICSRRMSDAGCAKLGKRARRACAVSPPAPRRRTRAARGGRCARRGRRPEILAANARDLDTGRPVGWRGAPGPTGWPPTEASDRRDGAGLRQVAASPTPSATSSALGPAQRLEIQQVRVPWRGRDHLQRIVPT